MRSRSQNFDNNDRRDRSQIESFAHPQYQYQNNYDLANINMNQKVAHQRFP